MITHRGGLVRWVGLVLAAIFLLTPVIVTQAQNNQSQQLPGNGLRISPTRTELSIERGKTASSTITVQNVTNANIIATPFINDFLADDNETGEPRVLLDESAEPTPYSIREFVSPLKEFHLKPGEKEEVRVRLSVSSSTAPGSYFGVIRFSTINDNQEQGNVALAASVGTIMLIQVPGDVTELLTVEQLSAAKGGSLGSFFESAPDSVVVRVKNQGNTFVKPFGQVNVKNWSGDVVWNFELNGTQPRGNVLPGSIRRFENELKGVGRFGRYTIEANVSYGDGSNIIPVKETFWVIPWRHILLVLALLTGLAAVAVRFLGGYNRPGTGPSTGTTGRK